VAIDWPVAETLAAIGVMPVAAGSVADYNEWRGHAVLDESVANLGIRFRPNLELIASLEPDCVLISRALHLKLVPRLERIAPVQRFPIYQPDGDTWQQLRAFTREIGRAVGRAQAARRYLDETQAHLRALRRRVPDTDQPLLIVHLVDGRYVNVYGERSLFHPVLERLGLANAWQRDTNRWGFERVHIRELADIDARLVVLEGMDPVPFEERLAASPLWQNLPSVRGGDVLVFNPGAWIWSALPSARSFADKLVAELEASNER
jgi:iron complex transport system substrate-binding protein